jgi:hypothetical protein
MEANLVALDVVEVSPPYDVSDNTVNNAHRVVLEALAGLAWRKRQTAGGEPGLPGRSDQSWRASGGLSGRHGRP